MADRFSSLSSDPLTRFPHAAIEQGEFSSRRSVPPANFLLKLERFSSITANLKVQSYESGIFEVGGYKWRLSIYPEGDRKRNGAGHVSAYLILVDAKDSFSVNVNYKICIYDQIRDEYFTMESLSRCFHKMNTQYGFPKLISLNILRDHSNGYLINDTCIFGAEIFVLQKYNKRQHHFVALHDAPKPLPYILFSLKNFSKLKDECYHSDVYCLGGKKWKFIVYPNGDSLNKGKLSVYLQMVEPVTSSGFLSNLTRMIRRDKHETSKFEIFPHGEGLLFEFIFQIVDHVTEGRGNHVRTVLHKFDANWTTSNSTIKCGDMLCRGHLMNPAHANVLMDDVLCISAQFYVLAEAKNT